MVAQEGRDVVAGRAVRQRCRTVLAESGARDPIGPLLAAIDRALTGSVLAGDATSIALSIWAALYGLVTLELAGALDTATAESVFDSTIHATLRGWTTPES
ncbi:TetR-like C-terminal domain-containing protein [Streptomyces sp. NPDC059766]|uniref:TetR-like C-terminal domain-containing protein n=1 Tax=Streptomyces sp. NPDC059766 TaxID=3346940 RepID=UPI0036590E2A